jgi:protein MpaA
MTAPGSLPHPPHEYGILARAWAEAAPGLGLRLGVLCEHDGHEILVAENERFATGEDGGLYLSAGVHGDECAPVWGLLEWADSDPSALRDRPVLIFPCLNPAGLLANSRLDGGGVDLNRSFTDAGHPLVAAWRQALAGRRFELALNLHEDYDARGLYLYELTRGPSRGDALLAACEEILPRETAAEIDGTAFDRGLVVRGEEVAEVVATQLGGGWPEAIVLFVEHAAASITFETPSEDDLGRRIAAHRRFLEAACGG